MSGAEAGRNPVEQLAEAFLERYRRGERPSLDEYTSQHPELAEQIRLVFPALVMTTKPVRAEASDLGGHYRVGCIVGRYNAFGVVAIAIVRTADLSGRKLARQWCQVHRGRGEIRRPLIQSDGGFRLTRHSPALWP